MLRYAPVALCRTLLRLRQNANLHLPLSLALIWGNKNQLCIGGRHHTDEEIALHAFGDVSVSSKSILLTSACSYESTGAFLVPSFCCRFLSRSYLPFISPLRTKGGAKGVRLSSSAFTCLHSRQKSYRASPYNKKAGKNQIPMRIYLNNKYHHLSSLFDHLSWDSLHLYAIATDC